MSSSPNERISSILCRLFAVLYEDYGIKAKQMSVTDDDGPAVTLPFPKSCRAPRGQGERPRAGDGGDEAPTLTRTERRILEVVGKLNADSGEPTGSEIAAAAKLGYDQNFRVLLSGLRKKGLLGGSAGGQGYPLTAAGYELSHAENGEK